MSWTDFQAERAAIIDRLHDEITRKSRQLAEARRLLRQALKYGVTIPATQTFKPAECAQEIREQIERGLPLLDDRTAKRKRQRRQR